MRIFPYMYQTEINEDIINTVILFIELDSLKAESLPLNSRPCRHVGFRIITIIPCIEVGIQIFLKSQPCFSVV